MGWNKGCPAGGMFHRFDKVTHRCRCGRWQAGFAPKKEKVKPRCECQICERVQATDKDGTLGHHGYRRPGWGIILGDCMGEGHRPFPATDALERYRLAVENHRERCRARLEELPTIAELPYEFLAEGEYRKARKDRQTTTVNVPRGGEYKPSPRSCGVTFATLEMRETARMSHEIEMSGQELKRVDARIARAKELTAA